MRQFLAGCCDTVKVVDQHVRIEAAYHNRLSPLIPEPTHQFDGIFFAECLAAAESRMSAKVNLLVRFCREECSHSSAHRFRPGDSVLFPVGVKRFDLRFRKIDNSPHAVIIECYHFKVKRLAR